MLNYIFRKPKFPVICNFDGILIAAKREIIALYNSRKNSFSDGNQYSDKSLSAKRFDKIFTDIVYLLLKS
jgi:hypothetical protein